MRNDIDFDELDRAVNSVLGNKTEHKNMPAAPAQTQHPASVSPAAAVTTPDSPEGTAQAPSPERAAPQPSIPALSRSASSMRAPAAPARAQESLVTTQPKASPPSPVRPETTQTTSPPIQPRPSLRPAQNLSDRPSPTKTPAATSAAVTNRTHLPPRPTSPGRAMDVVQPPQTLKKVSSVGKSLRPLSPMDAPNTSPQPKHDIVHPVSKKSPLLTDTSEAKDQPKKLTASHEDLITEHAASHPETAPQSTPSPHIGGTQDKTSTPFLADTKVAKRPLGHAEADEAPAEELSKAVTGAVSASAAHKPPTIASIEDETPHSTHDEKTTPNQEQNAQHDDKEAQLPSSSLPPEFNKDIVNIEADDSDLPEDVDRPDTPLALPPEPHTTPPKKADESPPKPEEPAKQKPNKPLASPSSGQAASAASMSIPKQYQTKQAAPDKTANPVFDTSEYHTPLTPPPKKKSTSPWMWVLLVLVLLVLGVGLGIAAFYFIGY